MSCPSVCIFGACISCSKFVFGQGIELLMCGAREKKCVRSSVVSCVDSSGQLYPSPKTQFPLVHYCKCQNPMNLISHGLDAQQLPTKKKSGVVLILVPGSPLYPRRLRHMLRYSIERFYPWGNP